MVIGILGGGVDPMDNESGRAIQVIFVGDGVNDAAPWYPVGGIKGWRSIGEPLTR